jgi:DDE superfamily endonuclease
VAEIRAALAPGTPLEVWFQDEMRVGQKNKLTYRWARKGSRPRAAHDQRTQSTYLFGAVCPERGAGAALVLPACNCEAMQLHLDEIATKVAPGAHGRGRDASLARAHRVAGGGHPPPAPTERSMRICRTTLFGSWFTALQEPATPGKGDAALASVTACLL